MPTGVSNRAKISAVREVTPGTTPATPKWLPERLLSATLSGKPKSKQSAEVVSDRMLGDLAVVGIDTDGNVSGEMSYQPTQTVQALLLESALWSAEVRTPECDNNNPSVGVCSAIAAATDYPITGGQAFSPGMLVRASGFTSAVNNKTFSALAASSTTTIKTAGLTIEAAPLTARLKCIGFQPLAAADVLAVTAGGNALTSTATNFVLMGLVPGMWIMLGTTAARLGTPDAFSFAITPANNGMYRISAVTTTRLSFDIVPTGFAADAATGKTIRGYFGDYLRNGVTPLAMSIEQQHPDLTAPAYIRYVGMFVDTCKIGLTAQDIMTMDCALKGLDTIIGTVRFAGSTDGILPSADVMNTSSAVIRVAENGVVLPGAGSNYLLSMDITLTNNIRALPAVGQLGYIGINPGQHIPQGTAKFYFGDTTILAKARAGTASSIDFTLQDLAGNAYTLDLPKIKYGTAVQDVGGLNQDLTVDTTFSAMRYTPPTGANYAVHLQRYELAGT